MASLITHAALPLLFGRAVPAPAGVSKRRLWATAALFATVADVDVIAPVLDLRGEALLAHRGLLHGLPFAALLALLGALMFPSARRAAFAVLFAAAASHPLLDLFTHGDVGVALFSPFTRARLLFPFRPLPVCPLGVDEYLGKLGAAVLFDELLIVVAPLAIAVELYRRRRAGRTISAALTIATAAWVSVTAVVAALMPWVFGPVAVRELRGYGPPGSDDDFTVIPLAPLPEQALVTRFDAFGPWLGRRLEPEAQPWSSTFYPAWLGSEAGRWRDGRLALIARTLTGTAPPGLPLGESGGLAPTEKYDLAHDDTSFSATRVSLGETHNRRARPRFWFGLCNGVAAASIARPEPFRAVDVVSPSGRVVRFHPIDIKALLAKAYYWNRDNRVLGGQCTLKGFDSGRTCSMNPGELAIATVNYLGRARRSFMLDVYPTAQSQYYAVASAQLDVTRGPYPLSTEPIDPDLTGQVTQLVDVDFDFALSSTLLPVESGDLPAAGEGRYERVGVRPVLFHWAATLALDADSNVIGGRWRGDPADGPDAAAFPEGGPLLSDGGVTLEANPRLDWAFIDALANKSVEESATVPRLETADVVR